jgi:cell division protein FtsW
VRSQARSYDRWLIGSSAVLILLGLIMVASASIILSERSFHQPFHFLLRQLICVLLGLLIGGVLIRFEVSTWRNFASVFLLLSFGLLMIVLIPGIGRHVNGSTRWLGYGGIGIQVSELAKLLAILYLADYIARREYELSHHLLGFMKPVLLFCLMALLLLREPDFGAVVVLMVTVLSMLFLAGVRLSQFVILLGSVGAVLVGVAMSSQYRMARLSTFLNPWSNQFDGGYQLTQSLIAFGRGGWFGMGLGNSIQKLFYLPEAHTDFVLAVFAEEFGLMGVLFLIGLFILLVARIFMTGLAAERQDKKFQAFICYGCALWIATQTLINMGVNTGILPTKGLTLPLISYGGSSVLVMSMVLALIFRIDYENRRAQLKALRSK